MGNMFKKNLKPMQVTLTNAPAEEPPEGGFRTLYKVEGIWGAEGKIRVPERLVIEMSEGRYTEKPGDTVELTRLEAAVLGRTVMLTPVFGAAE
jgi:hypothetical protein